MKKMSIVLVALLLPLAVFAGSLTWQNTSPQSGTHFTPSGSVSLYLDNGDSVFTWGGEGSALQTTSLFYWSGGYIFGDTYNYGTWPSPVNLWAVYYDPTGPGYYAVSSDGLKSFSADPIGNGNPNWNVGNAGQWVAIPEPTTMALFGLGLAALVVRSRLRRQ